MSESHTRSAKAQKADEVQAAGKSEMVAAAENVALTKQHGRGRRTPEEA